jgi:deoxycytidine triphosphate deaminase
VTPPGTADAGAAPGAVLTDLAISRLVSERGLISDFHESSLQGASYDLRLGSEFFTRGKHSVLTEQQPSHRLDPGQFILLTSQECLTMPLDIVGHAGLMSKWAQRGLISLFSPQIDPGFRGRIVVPLFNGGHAPVTVKLGEPMFTIEFVRTTGWARLDWSATHAPLMGIPAAVEVEMVAPDLSDVRGKLDALDRDVAALAARLDGYQIGTGERKTASGTRAQWISLGIALLALVAALVPIASDVL